ncbi:alpha/beta fold hydrolase [Streptomyces meridianus]|uniref:Alpha/beta hydrolase n=1 Tax=Streptomyces meridianus TaxID=2938945 RepID=A0ABT0X905_9ACTN|nr:alpha/beta hydrolase [Streptomyces meridianus]MCM2579008.1 alpha/beta hydrolase [Streptomyces meridianus]
MTAVVLVHGLYEGPEHFAPVTERLRAEGVEVAVPELHRGSLAADTAAVQEVVDAMGGPPIVVGHSYGGSVITGLTGVRHLVYLAAFVPDEGESAAGLSVDTNLIGPAIVKRPDGLTDLDPVLARTVLFNDCTPGQTDRAVALLRPQALGCGRGIPERQAWKDVPSTYVVCTEDRTVDPGLQRTMAKRCGSTRVWPTGHAPFVSRPDLLTGLIAELLSRKGS